MTDAWRQRKSRKCDFCKKLNCLIAHSMKPSKLRKCFERIEATVAGWTDEQRADVIQVGGPAQ